MCVFGIQNDSFGLMVTVREIVYHETESENTYIL